MRGPLTIDSKKLGALGFLLLLTPALTGSVLPQGQALRLQLPPWVVYGVLDETVTLRTAAGEETFRAELQNGSLRLGTYFCTAPEWVVLDCLFGDIDRDGADEILLHVWKRGSFGQHKPFWREDDPQRPTEHLFLYEWDAKRSDRLDPKWMSSAMPLSGKAVWLDDSDICILDANGRESRWRWEEWGVFLVG